MEGGGEETMRGERILVSVRLRPLNHKEILRNDVSDWGCVNQTTIVYRNVDLSASERSMYPSVYGFDRVFNSDCSTRKVYEEAAKEVALSVVNGFNSSVFAYGQTSSGKTYTMTGITEYAISDIYDHIQKHTERDYVLKLSAMEIYNESVRDLLSSDVTPLRLLDDPERGTVVEKLTEETVEDWNHVVDLLSICEAQRQIGETNLNETSSRSHQIIRLTVESSVREFLGRDNSNSLIATVNFVDLAGSERASQSLSAGARLKEGCHINRSLLTLGTVIRKLSKGRNGHIPFRDSKLTRILQTSLGGNAKTAIICTMSPARSHVEQSRNTLLFASCAKEVTTNAQVNVVMSDKILVKHLQRELARLESELKSPTSENFETSDNAALLQEKDLQIEKLEKEVKELRMERDIAQAQVRDLKQMLGEERKSVIRVRDDESSVIRVGLGNYPNLRVLRSADDQCPAPEMSIMTVPHSMDADVRTCSDGHSRSSSDEQFIRVSSFEEDFLHNNSSQRVIVSSSTYSETDSCQGWDDLEKQSDRISEDLCKEVRCIDIEDSEVNEPVRLSYPFLEENSGFSARIAIGKTARGNLSPYSIPASPPIEEDSGSSLVPLKLDHKLVFASSFDEDGKSNRESVLPVEDEQELASPSFEDGGKSAQDASKVDEELPMESDSSDLRGSRITISRSCEADLVIDPSSPWNEEEEYPEDTGSERKLNEEPQGFEKEISSFNSGASIKASMEEEHFTLSADSGVDIQLEAPPKEKTSDDDNAITGYTCDAGTKEMTAFQREEDVTDFAVAVKQTERGADKPKKSVKDVGLDPIEDELRSLTNWPSEFKRLRKEIIELWHVCNVSLVHRTYFFLLFQGDSSDSIYMEVELRRLSFLKDAYVRGQKTVLNGRILSIEQSIKDLRAEKRMLTKQMLKKLTEQERVSLYLKWGIGLTSKTRRVQLVNRLWTRTDDMNHISDSAYLVAKLVRFMEVEKAPKEVFGLDFGRTRTSPSYSFKRSLISIL
ncbi:PREDICTED: kinesin-like protein KIN-7F isoform X3 [Ipomoea nil]|uniref:kinesin-like protein KIN-7F isoform X2 n=1 Tax=Ipomoea nil TaxID=35883 RepID=UPI0009018F24|nr:PREDICTED: kinesin-like protein KIN-7F isoform X2 [Ipomoea nil]XP_019177470.1 PREDICTED: kinesin-like protein KIN-7F isoform X3 [Ipomoea nil]